MHGKITKNDDTYIKNPNNNPTISPKFTNISKLLTKCSYISLHANRNPIIRKKLPNEKFITALKMKMIRSYWSKC